MAAKRTQAEMLTISFALPRARRSEVGDSTSSSLMGSIRVVLRRVDRAGALVRLKRAAKHKLSKREYKCTQQDLHQIYLHMHHYQQRGGGV